jgi:hypothetical protein
MNSTKYVSNNNRGRMRVRRRWRKATPLLQRVKHRQQFRPIVVLEASRQIAHDCGVGKRAKRPAIGVINFRGVTDDD